MGRQKTRLMSVWGDLGFFWVNHEGGMRVGQARQEESHGEQHMLSPGGTELQVGWVWEKGTLWWNKAEGARDAEAGLPGFTA